MMNSLRPTEQLKIPLSSNNTDFKDQSTPMFNKEGTQDDNQMQFSNGSEDVTPMYKS